MHPSSADRGCPRRSDRALGRDRLLEDFLEAASTSRVERPCKKAPITNDSKACVRVTPLPSTLLSNPRLPRVGYRGRRRSIGPAVV